MIDEAIGRQNNLIVEQVRSAHDAVVAIYRFGSTVTSVTRADSDVDVAVLTSQRMSPDAWFDLQEGLSAVLGREVDVLDLAVASPVLAVQVIAADRLIYDGDSIARGLFEDQALSGYARLNEERRGILERIAAEGTVYGR